MTRGILLSTLVLVGLGNVCRAQITVNNNVQLDSVLQVLLGSGVQFSNATFSGDANQVGTFLNPNTGVMGLGAGVIMATGDVLNAIGPNNASSSSLGGGNTGASDPDLDALDGFSHNDAAILEFDFVATGTTMNFQYVFASEEYPEYTGAGGCGNVSDVFGFFLSGPGITGTFSNNAINVALIPNSNQFVSIANLNAGCDGLALPGDEFCNFCEYYINNGDGFTDPFNADPMYLQYDGYTVVLNATYEGLQCGETYHIKLALADVSDTAFDSAVFLKESSFDIGGSFTINPSLPIAGNPTAMNEGCGVVNIAINNPSCNAGDTLVMALSYGGTAIEGADYLGADSLPLPDTIVFTGALDTLVMIVFPDGQVEGAETFTITSSYVSIEGDTITETAAIQIFDYTFPEVTTANLVICEEDIQAEAQVEFGLEPYVYFWDTFGDTAASVITYLPADSGQHTLYISDYCGISDSINFNVSYVHPIEPTSDTSICDAILPIQISAASQMNSSLVYDWTRNGSNYSNEPVAEITTAGIYVLNVSESACDRSNTATFNIGEFLQLQGEELSPCDALYSDENPLVVSLDGEGLSQPLIWIWQIADTIYSNTAEAAFGTMADNGVFEVTATQDFSQTGCNRSASAEVQIDMSPCDIVIPNVFTPNGDGKNDSFLGQYDALNSGVDVKLTVFNRWGNVVYENERYKGDWKANDVPDGTYYYTLKVSGALDARDSHGYVTILRNE